MKDKRCKCSMAISLTGDGCRYCQPQEYIDRLETMISEMSRVEAEIESASLPGSTVEGSGEDAGLKNGGWVSVEDKLPQIGDIVLGFEPHCRNNDDKGLEVLIVDKHFVERKSDGPPWVTHWMPLPKIPVGDF